MLEPYLSQFPFKSSSSCKQVALSGSSLFKLPRRSLNVWSRWLWRWRPGRRTERGGLKVSAAVCLRLMLQQQQQKLAHSEQWAGTQQTFRSWIGVDGTACLSAENCCKYNKGSESRDDICGRPELFLWNLDLNICLISFQKLFVMFQWPNLYWARWQSAGFYSLWD